MRIPILFLLLSVLITPTALAVEPDDVIGAQSDAASLDELTGAIPDEAAQLLEGVSLDTDVDFDAGITEIFSSVAGNSRSILRTAAKSAATVMVIAMLCGLVGSLHAGSGSEVPDYVPLVGVLAITAAAVGSSSSFIGLGVDVIDKLGVFSKALLPTLAATATAGGAVTSAAAKYAAAALFLDVLLTLTRTVIMPLIYAYIAASVGSAAIGGGALDGAASLLKWMANMLITAVMICFVGYLTISGLVSGTADAVTIRVAKTAISTALPVVGGIIADAAGTVVAGMGMIRSAVGVIGMLVVLAVCLLPILQLGAHYLMFKAAAGLSACVADSRITKLIGSLGSAFGMVMGLTGAGAIMMFFSIFSLMKVVTG